MPSIPSPPWSKADCCAFLPAQATQQLKQAYGGDDLRYAQAVQNTGVFYLLQGNQRAAEKLVRQALGIKGRVLTDRHPDYCLALLDLAAV